MSDSWANLDGGRFLADLYNTDSIQATFQQKIINAINNLGSTLGANPVGLVQPPPTIDGVNTSVSGEMLQISLNHNHPVNRGINYFSEIDTNPNFSQPIVVAHGPSRTSTPLSLPTYNASGKKMNYYVRSYAQYLGSKPCAPTVYGGPLNPASIQMGGATQMDLLPSTGSGTASPTGQQGGSGYGKVPSSTSVQGPIQNSIGSTSTQASVAGNSVVGTLQLPSIFTVSGSSPITALPAGGPIIVTFNTQSANLVFAGPASGAAAVPTFRSLVVADLPANVAFLNVAQNWTAIQTFVSQSSSTTPVVIQAPASTPANLLTFDDHTATPQMSATLSAPGFDSTGATAAHGLTFAPVGGASKSAFIGLSPLTGSSGDEWMFIGFNTPSSVSGTNAGLAFTRDFNIFGTNDLFMQLCAESAGYAVFEGDGLGCVLATGTATPVVLAPNRINMVAVTTTGMGIKKTSPAYPLDVLGDINTTTEYRVGGTQIASSNLGDVTGWVTTTPTPTSGTGTLTTATAQVRYFKIGKLVTLTVTVHITTNGTGATNIQVPLPFTAGSTANFELHGLENAVTGLVLLGQIAASSTNVILNGAQVAGSLCVYGAYPGGNGYNLVVSGSYESST